MTTELARIESITPAELFKPGTLDPILGRIREEVRREAACLDISTEANRKALAALAYKVAKSKTFIDAQRKKLVAGEKERLKAIDQEGGRIWDELEELQAEVRKPLTDWENAEKERVARLEAELQELINCGIVTLDKWEYYSAESMRDRLKEIMEMQYDWQEFHSRAVAAVTVTIRQMKEAIAKREKWEAEQEELTRLRAAQALRDQQEREAEIARAATEKAQAEAERIAQAAARAAQEAQERVEAEKHAAEARAKHAEAQRAQLERQAAEMEAEAQRLLMEAEQAAERAAEAAKIKAEHDREAAVAAERQRLEDARKAEEAAAEKREANKRHCAKINREVRDALMQESQTEGGQRISIALAERLVSALAKDRIPHTQISY
jgi:hypothetical protein